MTSPSYINEFFDLMYDLVENRLPPGRSARLEEMLLADSSLHRKYVDFLSIVGGLHRIQSEGLMARGEGQGMVGFPTIDLPVRAAVDLPRQLDPELRIPSPEFPALPFPSLSPLPSPLSPNFVGGPVFSYMASAVILGLMLLGAWVYTITHFPPQVVLTPLPTVPTDVRPELVFVGRITGMRDCRWADPRTEAYAGASVPLKRRYALSSGLMEITYKTGAKVILEGPCVYIVESQAGGFLALGKLTAKVEARGEGRGVKGDSHYPLFSVRTPTAVITDLGTEFGVEVSEEGNTMSHVFRGSVRVEVVGDDLPSPAERGAGGEGCVVLRENESARVDAGKSLIRLIDAGEEGAKRFVRSISPPKSVRDGEAYAKLVLFLRPVIYYRMERPKNKKDRRMVFDLAGGGHHGDLRLGAANSSPYVSGRFGSALWLRGPAVDDHVIVSDYPKATDDRLTVSAWVMATGRPFCALIASNWSVPLGQKDVPGQFHLGLYERDLDLSAHVAQRDGSIVEVREGASRPFPLFLWQHVVFVADGATLRLYRNGKEVASSPCVGVLPQPPVAGLGIGCRMNAAGTDVLKPMIDDYIYYWHGRIDELAVFNQALSAAAIERLYLGKPLPNRPAETTPEDRKKGQPMER